MTTREDVRPGAAEQAAPEAPAEQPVETPPFELPDELKTYVEGLRKDNAGTRDELDKTLITLSTATMGVMLTLRQQIATGRPEGMPPLGFSPLFWGGAGLLFVTIMAVLASHFVSLAVNRRIIDSVEGLTSWDDAAYQRVLRAQSKVRHVHRLNLLSSLAFVAGLALSVLYVTSIAN